MPQALLSLLKITVASQGIFWFQTKVRTVFILFLWKMPVGFWYWLHWIGRSLGHFNNISSSNPWEKIAFHLFVSYSISVIGVLNSQCADFSPSCLKLFPSIIYYFWCYVMGFFSWFPFLIDHYWCKEIQLIFIYCFCILNLS